jgi:hypothetical protein
LPLLGVCYFFYCKSGRHICRVVYDKIQANTSVQMSTRPPYPMLRSLESRMI